MNFIIHLNFDTYQMNVKVQGSQITEEVTASSVFSWFALGKPLVLGNVTCCAHVPLGWAKMHYVGYKHTLDMSVILPTVLR